MTQNVIFKEISISLSKISNIIVINWFANLGIKNQDTPRGLVDTAERINYMSTHFAWNIVDVVLAFTRSVDCPVAEVADSASKALGCCIHFPDHSASLHQGACEENRPKWQCCRFQIHFQSCKES